MIPYGYRDDLEIEIKRTADLGRKLIGSYEAWSGQVGWGDTGLVTHGDLIDFVNFRMETADSCLKLIEAGKVGDALGLCRSLLENYLLFMLICRGEKYFRFWDLSNETPEEFVRIFQERKKEWEAERAAGTTTCVEFRKHPRAKRHIMLVYDGITLDDGEKMPVSMYYFHFEQFKPDIMRLNADDYFEYYERPADLRKALKGHRQEAQLAYQHFLSYDALVMCLELNDLLDEAGRRRLEAHYTFLGTFLHPTHDAMRNLHDRSNWHTHKTMVGMEYSYTQTARLLANTYVCHLVAGILDEFATFFEAASEEYVKDPSTADLRAMTNEVRQSVSYFWFLFNEAPLYQKFKWAVSHATDQQLAESGGYRNLSSTLVQFDQHIYDTFGNSLVGQTNWKVGSYVPPLGGGPRG